MPPKGPPRGAADWQHPGARPLCARGPAESAQVLRPQELHDPRAAGRGGGGAAEPRAAAVLVPAPRVPRGRGGPADAAHGDVPLQPEDGRGPAPNFTTTTTTTTNDNDNDNNNNSNNSNNSDNGIIVGQPLGCFAFVALMRQLVAAMNGNRMVSIRSYIILCCIMLYYIILCYILTLYVFYYIIFQGETHAERNT